MQNIALIFLNHAQGLNRAEDFKSLFAAQLPVWENLLHEFDFRVSVFQRALFTKHITHNFVDIYFVADGYERSPQKLQRTEKLHAAISEVDPAIVQVHGLDLPLHFRWLRARLGNKPLLIGEHGGEAIWHHRQLWLQQLGLRSADAFFFQKKQDAHSWLKHAAILPCQPVFEMAASTDTNSGLAELMTNSYRRLIRWRKERN